VPALEILLGLIENVNFSLAIGNEPHYDARVLQL